MEYLGLISTLGDLARPDVMLCLVGGTLYGVIVGILPGLGGAVALALLIPLSIGLNAHASIALLLSAYGAGTFGGSISAILINTPGDPVNAATCLDGYPLAKQGKAMVAITAALVCSAAGGCLGLLILTLLIPVAYHLVLMFSYPDFFMLALFGLVLVSRLARGNILLGLISTAFGLLLSYVGTDPVLSEARLTFGTDYLWDGIRLLPTLIGIFAVGEALSLSTQRDPIARVHLGHHRLAAMREGLHAVAANLWLFVRSSLVGFSIGVVPGVGGVVAALTSYTIAAQSSRNREQFGHGAIEGVIAAESATDAKEGGSLLPTLVFGIPGSAGMVVLMGGLTLHGITPGPELVTSDMGTVNFLIAVALVGKIFAFVLALLVGIHMTFLTRIRGSLLAPGIVIIALTGAYSQRGDIGDVIVAALFGVVGWIMDRYGFSRIGFVIALVLGKLIETSYLSTMTVFGASGFFTRPIALGMLALTIFTVVSPLWGCLRRREMATS